MSNTNAPVSVAGITTVCAFLEATDAEQREIIKRASYAKHAQRPALRYAVALELMKRVAMAEHDATGAVGGRDASVYGRFMPGNW